MSVASKRVGIFVSSDMKCLRVGIELSQVSRVFLEKVIFANLVEKSCDCHKTKMYIGAYRVGKDIHTCNVYNSQT
jgi:hypothetical protein